MSSRSSKRAVIAAEHREKAWGLRRAGWSLAQIGREIGISKQAVHKIIMAELETIQATVTEEARLERQLQLERMDYLWNTLYAEIVNITKIGGTVLTLLPIFDRLIKIAERQDKLLGLSAPTKFADADIEEEETKYNPYAHMTPEDRAKRIREVLSREGIDIPEE